MTIFIAHGSLVLILECIWHQTNRAWLGSEDGDLFWFCPGGGTVSRYFVKFAPGAVTFSSRFGND